MPSATPGPGTTSDAVALLPAESAEAPANEVSRPRTRAIVARLSAISVLGAALGLLTGPLQARALGPAGRGDLAAILVTLGVGGHVLTLAVGSYAGREVVRGRSPGELLGSLGAVVVLTGGLAACASVPLSHALADGRDVVQIWLAVGLLLMPVGLVAAVAQSLLPGMGRWNWLYASRLVPTAGAAIAVFVLYVLNELTVASAAATTVVIGLLASAIAIIGVLSVARPVVRWTTARAGTAFGLKTWVGSLMAIANARLDQLLMIPLVPARELGHYAVAVTVAGLTGFITGALGPPTINRVAAGDTAYTPRALRIVLSGTATLTVPLAISVPFVLPLLFGSDFSDAVDMAVILLAASMPLAGVAVLAPALQADGAPLIPSIAELATLVITVGGLFLTLKPLGGLGAALTSLVAYSVNFLICITAARRRFGGSLPEYLIIRQDDVRSILPGRLRFSR